VSLCPLILVADLGLRITSQASVYGKCILVDFNSVHKDQCAKEFMKLKDCYLVSIPRIMCNRNLSNRLHGDGQGCGEGEAMISASNT
jgi:hypothetical protein